MNSSVVINKVNKAAHAITLSRITNISDTR